MAYTYQTYPLDELMRNELHYQFRSAKTVTLTNAISPVFRRTQFKSIDCEVFRPVVRLASLELETPCLMAYPYAVCLSTPQKISYSSKKGKYGALLPKDGPLNEEDVAGVKHFLRALGQNLEFEHGELTSPGAQATCTSTGRHVDTKAFPVRCMGYGSIIRINSDRYSELLEALKQRDEEPDSTEKQDRLFSIYFALAQAMLHELAHAMVIARFGDRSSKCWPFGKTIFSEDGFDWESTIFDGRIDGDEGGMWMTDWPSPATVEHYMRKHPACIGVTGSVESLTAAKHSNVWRVPPCIVRAAFQKEFWKEVVPVVGSDALKIPRLLGYRMAPQRLGSIADCSCLSCFWLKEYILRANARGNKALAQMGKCLEQAVEAENARRRKANDEKRNKFDRSPVRSSHLSVPIPDSQVTVPIPKSRADYINPSDDCERGSWVRWMQPLNASDCRQSQKFGLPSGFSSLADGSVVAEQYMGNVLRDQTAPP